MAAEENPARAIRRLEARKVLRPMVDKMYEEGLRAAQSGEPVAWCMGNWLEGDAILRAMGVIQVFPENYGAVCAAMGVAPGFLSRCEAEGFPTHMCGYARNCIGYTARMVELGDIPPEAPMGGMPKPMLLVGSGMACDARYKWFQALRRYLEVPIWILEMPTPGYGGTKRERTYDSTMRYVVAELRDFVTFLEGLLKKKMDWDKLCEMVDNMEKVQRVWWEALEMRKAIPCPMHSRDLWSMMAAASFMAAEKESLDAYRQAYDEIKQRVDAGVGAIANEKYRLLFAELPPWHSMGFFDRLAARGWNFVVESLAYHPAPPLDLTDINDPLERIARQTFWSMRYSIENAVMRGDAATLVQTYHDWARDYRCDGVVLHPLISCRAATSLLMHASDVLLQNLKVPSLIIEGDIVDLTVFNEAQALNQAEAFEETMEHYRRIRKKDGMEW